MKIGIYNPYFDIIGGGERYVLTMGKYLSKNHQVDVFWDDPLLKKQLLKYLNLDFGKINFTSNIFSKEQNRAKRILILKAYDLLIYVTDGSLFFSPAKRNVLVVQSPAHCPRLNIFLERLKFRNWQIVLCYSYFVKKIIDRNLPLPAIVLPPPVDINNFKAEKKENVIFNVGRFFPWLHSKKQEVLVKAFKEMCQEGLSGWQLYLVGKTAKGAEDYLKKIRDDSSGYPIKIIEDASFPQLANLCGQAKIYWHATGFGEDLEKHPEKAEHFGITTVEAMSAGCVPVVIRAGAQPEIIGDEEFGFLWETLDELKEKTLSLIKDEKKRQRLSQAAEKRANDFSEEKFFENLSLVL